MLQRAGLVLGIAVLGCDGDSPPGDVGPVKLAPLLADDAAGRTKAANDLGGPDALPLVPVLVDALRDDAASVRAAAGRALARIGRAGLAVYREFLLEPKGAGDPLFKIGEGMLLLGSSATPADLHYRLGASFSSRDRRAAAALSVLAALIEIGPDETLDVLSGSIGEPDEAVKGMMLSSLALIGWSAASADHPARAGDLEWTLELLESRQPVVAHLAISLIGMLRPKKQRFVDALGRIGDEAHASARQTALQRLGAGEQAARPDEEKLPTLPELIAKLKQLDESRGGKGARRRAPIFRILDRLRAMGPAAKEAAPVLARFLGKEKGYLRLEVVHTLMAISDRHDDAIALELADLLREGSLGTEFAIELLSELGASAQVAVPALVGVLGRAGKEHGRPGENLADQSARLGTLFWQARRAKRGAVRVLAGLGAGAKPARAAIGKLRDHRDARLRYRVAVALRRIR